MQQCTGLEGEGDGERRGSSAREGEGGRAGGRGRGGDGGEGERESLECDVASMGVKDS